ncbi:hypothetical protein F1D05_29265 [Kribbella qitaiheensis]|uniref:PNPLA domain-containing protein n=1 Tax=Kribbella qitaiheensis TaxID=1544730 RepID=A0A7G6X4T8_9ACTN|nr:hypothetical protein [Kribbella qitaiheensis]QNE21253.1 hypothetical protein F1D05_29265 [Kribbella qitaiheensis]
MTTATPPTIDALATDEPAIEVRPPEPPPVPAPEPADLRTVGAFLAVLLVLWLAMNEISLLSAGFLATDGTSWSFGGMSGPKDGARIAQWNSILTPDQLPYWKELLRDYLVLDFLFIATYTIALYRLVPNRPRVWYAVFLLPLFDLAENIVTGVLRSKRCADLDCVPDGLVNGLTWFTALKWLAVVALVVLGLVKLQDQPLRRIGRALYLQRFSLLAFLPIAAMSIVPGSSVLDQLPDVQRRWLDEGPGLRHAAIAGCVYLVLLLTIFLLGRLRSDWALRRVRGLDLWPFYDGPGITNERHYDSRLWKIGPLLLPALALVLWLADWGTVFLVRLVIFCAIPLLVVALSRWRRGKNGRQPRPLRPVYPEYPSYVMATGDAIAVASVSLGGLGMIRAFSGLTALDLVDLVPPPHVRPLIALLIGAVLAVGPWFAAGPVLRMIARWDSESGVRGRIGRFLTPGKNSQENNSGINIEPITWLRFVLLLISVVTFLLLAAFPRPFGNTLGVLAAAILALSVLVIMLGVMVVYAQDRQPPDLFQWGPERLRTRSTPIITLLVLALLLTGLAGGKNDIHPVTARGTVPERPTMEQAFEAWVAQDDGCSIRLADTGRPGELSLRPMLMLAAEGGGIRAAYWTAATLGQIGAAGAGCGGHSTLFSAGASGGALGLSLGRFTTDPAAAAKSISGHQALGAAMISLLSGDLLATSAGLRFDAGSPYRDPKNQPLDRAGLMETSWEKILPELRTPFLAADSTTAARDGAKTVTGQLVLNSTVVRDGCVALVSQVDLSAGSRSASGTPVCGSEEAGSHNFDFFGFYGRGSNDDEKHCVGNLPALAGTMLANRFPYVTPSGTAARCRGLDPAQLVDGGYTDNTGLGTVVDLAPHWNKLVKDHNDQVAKDGHGEFVVPMVVYIENGTGPDFSTGNKEPMYDSRVKPGTGTKWPSDLPFVPRTVVPLVPELVVPPVTIFLTAKGDTTNSPQLLSEASRRLAPESLCTSSPLCDRLRAQKQLPNNVFVVHQSRQPSLSAPLGWVLSETSQSDLNGDLAMQAEDGCSDSDCGYPTLRNLVDILKPPLPKP